MRHRKKLFPLLGLGLLTLLGIVFYIFFIDPTQNFQLGSFSFSPIILFFFFIFIFVYSFTAFLLLNTRQGLIISIFITSALLLRFIGYTSYIYLIILVAICLLLELSLRKR